jgi:hypothetical protein
MKSQSPISEILKQNLTATKEKKEEEERVPITSNLGIKLQGQEM